MSMIISVRDKALSPQYLQIDEVKKSDHMESIFFIIVIIIIIIIIIIC